MKLNYRVLLRQKSDQENCQLLKLIEMLDRAGIHFLLGLGLLTIKIGCYGRAQGGGFKH